MAISPPSDLVLDVVQAANPADVQAAQAKLQANRAAYAASSLAEAGKGFGSTVDLLNGASTQAGLANKTRESGKADKIPAAYHKFEAMVLQNFVQNALPKSDTLYGKGSTGEMWRGMMADELGTQMSKDGGIGIADKMYQQQLQKMKSTGVANVNTDESDRKMALSAVTEFERKSLAKVSSDDDQTTVTSGDALTAKTA